MVLRRNLKVGFQLACIAPENAIVVWCARNERVSFARPDGSLAKPAGLTVSCGFVGAHPFYVAMCGVRSRNNDRRRARADGAGAGNRCVRARLLSEAVGPTNVGENFSSILCQSAREPLRLEGSSRESGRLRHPRREACPRNRHAHAGCAANHFGPSIELMGESVDDGRPQSAVLPSRNASAFSDPIV